MGVASRDSTGFVLMEEGLISSGFPFPALEKEIATHSSVLAWRIPGTGEPGGLPQMNEFAKPPKSRF